MAAEPQVLELVLPLRELAPAPRSGLAVSRPDEARARAQPVPVPVQALVQPRVVERLQAPVPVAPPGPPALAPAYSLHRSPTAAR